MSLPAILALCMGGIVCLTPLTLYLFGLGFVNRRERPTVASASWDFVALLLGLSGFLASGSLLALVGTLSYLRGFPLVARELRRSWGEEQTLWFAAAAVYLAGLGLVVGLAFLRRRRGLVVYNVSPEAADDALRGVFAEMNLPATRFGHLWSDGRGLVEVTPFHLFRHLAIRLLPADPRLCEELDRRLRAALATAPAADNPLGPWIGSAAISALLSDLCCVVLILAATVWAK